MNILILEGLSALFEVILILIWSIEHKQSNGDFPKLKKMIYVIICFFVLFINNIFSDNALIAIAITWCCTFFLSRVTNKNIQSNIILSLYFCGIIAFSDMVSMYILKLFTHENFAVLRLTIQFRIIGSISSKFITLLVIRLIYSERKIFVSSQKFNIQLFIHLLILPLTSLIILNQLVLLSNPNGKNISISYLLIISGLLIANVFEFNFFIREQKYEYEKNKNHFLQIQIQMQSEQYKMFQNSNNELRRVRHDLKNSLISLLGYIENQNNKKAKDYIVKQLNSIDSIYQIVSTGYYALDALLNYKIKKIRDQCIEIHDAIAIIEKIHIDEMDLCIILGNALDNAFEGCLKTSNKKKILIEINTFFDSLVIVIQNSCREDLTVKDISEYKTSKSDKDNHGFGLETIKKVCLKYNGYCEYSIEENNFLLYIYLNNTI